MNEDTSSDEPSHEIANNFESGNSIHILILQFLQFSFLLLDLENFFSEDDEYISNFFAELERNHNGKN